MYCITHSVCQLFIDRCIGKICVPVTVSCKCTGDCFLAPLREQYLEIFTDDNGQPQQRWKVMSFLLSACISKMFTVTDN